MEISCCQKLWGLFSYLLSFACLIFVCVWASWYRGGVEWSSDAEKGDPDLLFNLHPVMMVLGTLVFPTQSVLCYRMLPLSHMKAKVYHFVSHILGGMCMAIGLTSVAVFHMRKRLPHFRSLHSWFGLGTLGLYALQFVIGFLAYCWPKLPFGPRKSSLPTHQFVGCLCFAFSCVTVALGVNSKIDALVAYADPITKKAVDSFGPEVQLAQWIAVGAIVLMASTLYVILGGQKRSTRSERGSAEEIESLRRRRDDDDIYEHDM